MKTVQEKLAESLTASSTDMIPHLPYLLQDLWQLGGSPDMVVELLREPAAQKSHFKVLDICCGKGAVSVALAEQLGVYVKGFDLVNDFIQDARRQADKHGVYQQCSFETREVNDEIGSQRGWDAVLFCAGGAVLGNPDEMLQKLTAAVTTGGYVVLDEGYRLEDSPPQKWGEPVNTLAQWQALFDKHGLQIVRELRGDDEADHARNMEDLARIKARAAELAAKYPTKAAMFEQYVENQRAEIEDIDTVLVNVVWLLQKK